MKMHAISSTIDPLTKSAFASNGRERKLLPTPRHHGYKNDVHHLQICHHQIQRSTTISYIYS
jgi:hypothetical protein